MATTPMRIVVSVTPWLRRTSWGTLPPSAGVASDARRLPPVDRDDPALDEPPGVAAAAPSGADAFGQSAVAGSRAPETSLLPDFAAVVPWSLPPAEHAAVT